MKWGAIGKDGMEWNRKGWDGVGSDGIRKDEVGLDGIGKDEVGLDGIGKDCACGVPSASPWKRACRSCRRPAREMHPTATKKSRNHASSSSAYQAITQSNSQA